MTERQSCTDPQAMLDLLRMSSTVSDRRLRLFVAACCRRIWRQLSDERSRMAVDVLERYAEGRPTQRNLPQRHELLRQSRTSTSQLRTLTPQRPQLTRWRQIATIGADRKTKLIASSS